MDPCRGAGEFDTGTVVTVVPVSGTEGGSAPREAYPRIRLFSPLALFSFIHFPNYTRPLLRPYFELGLRWCRCWGPCRFQRPRRRSRHRGGRQHVWRSGKSGGIREGR